MRAKITVHIGLATPFLGGRVMDGHSRPSCQGLNQQIGQPYLEAILKL